MTGRTDRSAGDLHMLRIDQLTHVYPNGTRALDAVSLEVPRGMFGLLGPNGAGKSSLMRCIATLQIPTQGSIRCGDIDVLANPEALRRTLGYLPRIQNQTTARLIDHGKWLQARIGGLENHDNPWRRVEVEVWLVG